MIHRCIITALTAACLFAVPSESSASPIFLTSITVTSLDRIATFDGLSSTSIFIGSYVEDSLAVSLPINQSASVGFTPFAPGDGRDSGFYYGSGGSTSYVDIRGTDGAAFTALDFLLGDGEAPPVTNVRWQTFLNGSLTGSGAYSGLTKGATVGWADTSGFDVLRVAASAGSGIGQFSPDYLPGFGQFQSIAIDDLRVQLAHSPVPPGPTPVPEPNSLILVASGLALLRRAPSQRSAMRSSAGKE